LIRVELATAELSIEPGATAQLTITVSNNGDSADQLAIDIEGIDVEWYAIPVPSVLVAPGASETMRVLFKVPRSSGSLAGTYPFLVRARGMESGASGVQQGTLVVKPFSSLQLEISPKRASATYFHPVDTREVTIGNLGNRPETLDLYASDPDDACGYEFEPERVSVQPGHSETVRLSIEPRVRPILGSTHLYGFTVTARSTQDSFVSDNVNGQLERKAVMSTLTAGILAVLALAAVLFLVFRPHPVAIRRFDGTPLQVTAGDPVKLSWAIDNPGEGSYINPGNLPVKDRIGNVTVNPMETTTYTLVARGVGTEQTRSVVITVLPKPPPAGARIVEFTGSPKRIHQGDAVILSWKVENATQIVLNPVDPVARDPRVVTSREVRPEQTTKYELTAIGVGGDVVKKEFVVTVVDPSASAAEILAFKARPEQIEAGKKSTLTWAVEGATAIDIDNGIGGNLKPRDRFDVMPHETTTYTLTATDNRGLRRTASVTVTVTQPPTPDGTPPVATPPDAPGAPRTH
jgi:hypothetical protein